MRKYLLVLFAIFISACSFAGNKIDSLKALLKTQPEDSTRAHTLMSLAYMMVHQDQKESIKLAREALALSEKVNYSYGIGYTNFEIGKYMQATSNFDSALYYFDKTFFYFEKAGKKDDIGRSYYAKGMIASTRGNMGDAENFFMKSQKIFESTSNKKEQVNAMIALAIVLGQMGQLEKKMAYLEEALKIKKNRMIQ